MAIIGTIGRFLHASIICTQKFIFSFVDISPYNKVAQSFSRRGVASREWKRDEMLELARGVAYLNQQWSFDVSTCCVGIDL